MIQDIVGKSYRIILFPFSPIKIKRQSLLCLDITSIVRERTISRFNGGAMLRTEKHVLFLLFLLFLLIPGEKTFAEKGNWVQIGKEWTYTDAFGRSIPGWIAYKGSWYYIAPDRERMATGWIFDNGKWYFLSTNQKDLGKMHRFWATIDGYAYYFDESGAMAEKTTVQGKYKVNEQGQYLQEDGKPKYYGKSGYRTKPSTVIDELMAKAEQEMKNATKPKISGLGNPSFTARYGLNPKGVFDPGPNDPWGKKENVDMQQYDTEEDSEETPDDNDTDEEEIPDSDEQEEEDE